MDEKGKGNGLNLDNLRMDPEDIINPGGKKYVHVVRERSRPLWLDIMLGIVGAMFVIWLISFAFITLGSIAIGKSAQKALEDIRVDQVQQQQMRSQERQHQEQLRIQEIQRQQRLQQLSSPNCRFWTEHYRNNRDQRSLENVRRYCPD